MKKICLLFICLLTTLSVQVMAQGQLYDLPKVLPPSPNAASLGKFGDIPVGKYTGIPSVSIPLYTMNVGKFSLPISIDYHSGGLKVEELSGNMGLNWAFNAGGVISRSMHAQPDESANGYWQYAGWTNATIASSLINTQQICGGTFDMQPDVFYFNFAGQSGKFILDATAQHNAKFMPYTNLKLTHDATLNSFHITDANGIIYNFSSKETTMNDNAGSLVMTFTSAWYLTSIITPAGNINFTYATEATSQSQLSEADFLNAGNSPCSEFVPGITGSTDEIDVNALVLTQIQSPFETINIQKTPNRKDMSTASMISGLTVTDMFGRLVKQFAFQHSYFGNVNSANPNDVRLKLDEVDELSVSGTSQKKSYILQYNSPASVPSVASFAKDYWGFYNGHDANTTDLPYIDPVIYGAYVANQATNYGIRTPDYTKSEIGMLQSIQYPTGGTSQFIYEGNDYSTSDGIVPHQTTNVQQQASVSAKWTSTVNIPSSTVNFSISTAQTVTFTFTGSFMGGPTPAGNGPCITLNKINADNSRTSIVQLCELNASYTQYKALTVGNYELIATVDGNNLSMTGNISYYYVDTLAANQVHIFPTGGVRIKQIINTDPATGLTNTKSYSYLSTTDPTRSSGALVSDYVILDSKKSYSFGCTYLERASTSNNYLGVTQGSHVGYGVVTETDQGTASNGRTETYFYTSADFQNVWAQQYAIMEQADVTTLAPSIRYQTDMDVFRGFLKQEIIYNAGGNILHSTVNNYNFASAILSTSPNYYAAAATAGFSTHICTSQCGNCTEPPGIGACPAYSLENFALANYQVICPWIYKTSTITNTFDQNGQNPVIDTTYYYYDNPGHAQVTRTTVTNSKGEFTKTVNIYASDKSQIAGLDATSSLTLDSMVNRNMIAPVIQQERYNRNSLLTRSRTDYQIWPGTRRNIAPTRIWYQVGANTIEDRINFLAYDSNDNLTQVAKAADANISYLWDYNSDYPIAEVKNAAPADIAYTSFEADGAGNWTVASANRDSVTTAFTGYKSYVLSNGAISKSGLTAAKIYIVSYWRKNGAALTITGTVTGYPITGPARQGWTYYEHHITGVTSVSLSGTGSIDELRLYPIDAQMTTYTYNPQVGETSSTDAKSETTYYDYDNFERLMNIKDKDGNITRHLDYHYIGQ